MMNSIQSRALRYGLFGVLLCIAPSAFAGLTSNLIGFTWFIHIFLKKLCILTGGALLVGSLMQYHNHRMNPMNVRFSQVMTMFILGLSLIGLGYLPMMGEQAPKNSGAYAGYDESRDSSGGDIHAYHYTR